MIRDTLLIIDDSELDRAILNEIFKNLFHVECVANATQGMQYLREHAEQVCAVLLDLCLERRDAGFDVLHTIQDDPVSSNLPVVLITADAHEKDVRSGVERGAVDFLAKPVDPHTVQKRVCQMVRATWPPMATILDQMDKSKDKNPPDAAESPAAPLTPENSGRSGCASWRPSAGSAPSWMSRPACSWVLSPDSLHGAMYSSIPNWD